MKSLFKKVVIELLERESKAVLKKYKPKIVAITGSVGKTSTKDAINTVLSRFYLARASKKSFNSDIGVPLTILDLPNGASSPIRWIKNLTEGLLLILLPNLYPEWLVLEVGADHPGDIKKIGKWLKPDVVVVTALSEVPVHVEFFESPERLFEEKGELVKALKSDGTLILNADDRNVLNYKNLFEGKTILYGNNNVDADISAKDYEVIYDEDDLPKGITFNIVAGEEMFPIYLSGTLGKHHTYHVLAALAVCKSLGEHLSVASKGFKDHEPTPGRMRLLQGANKSIIIDDTYNSSPIAVFEALNSLNDLKKAKRKIAVLGDMLELGKYSIDEHKKAGMKSSEVTDMLVTVGIRAKFIGESAVEAGMKDKDIRHFDDSKEAGEFLRDFIKAGDAVLVKGSQGIRMERIVEQIMMNPDEKEVFLVRQDKEWQGRL
jgi:UDP-N-acetylmuramoyl-tripeptide--D-alanyl-D-alanine ligase